MMHTDVKVKVLEVSVQYCGPDSAEINKYIGLQEAEGRKVISCTFQTPATKDSTRLFCCIITGRPYAPSEPPKDVKF